MLDIKVIAVGSLNNEYQKIIAKQYLDKIHTIAKNSGLKNLQIIEIKNSKCKKLTQRIKQEASDIQGKLTNNHNIIVLDEKGQNINSQQFYQMIFEQSEDREINFVIGGKDGLDTQIKQNAKMKIALGNMTWTHKTARLLLLEQIYRAVCIKKSSPYHNEKLL